jgi:hypothetical protein
MASKDYIYSGRKQYARPQGMLWADNPGTTVDGFYVPDGVEYGADSLEIPEFIVLTDDNRSEIQFSPQRIEQRKRMVNGRMRSYHIADKLQISTSWQMIPSRSSNKKPNFDTSTGLASPLVEMYTSDGGAGGNEILDWYENHKGSFWVYLAYDKYKAFGDDDAAYGNMGKYNQVIEMYISNFSYTTKKRGSTNLDLWDINVTLEEA